MSLTESHSLLLRPVLGLVSWTFIMEVWMYRNRIAHFTSSKSEVSVQSTKAEFKAAIPREVEWPAENYDHLHEQPTVFYAVSLALASLGVSDPWTVRLSWTYVALRMVHSLVHANGGPLMRRFGIFVTSSLVLAGLTAKAIMTVW